MHVSLIGFMGSGKSTVGKAIADRLGRAFVDTDAEVERMLGMSARDIFDKLGEATLKKLNRKRCRSIEAFGADCVGDWRGHLVQRAPWNGCAVVLW